MRRIFAIAMVLGSLISFGQHNEPCGHVEYMDLLEDLHPGFKDAVNHNFEDMKAQAMMRSKFDVQDTVYTIQVVFHVVYGNIAENLPDSLIHSQVEVLNNCFRRQNADTVNTRAIFKDVAGDAGIQFKLAEYDPDGNPTSGITRTNTSIANFTEGSSSNTLSNADRVKQGLYGMVAWDPSRYMNVWVCDLGSSLYGYAFPPVGAPNWNSGSFVPDWRQGVVLNFRIVGENNRFSSFTGEKTAVHEVGHYLGLRHIWGDAPSWDRCNPVYDDGIDDTPLAGYNSVATSCPTNKNSCYSGQGDMPDMFENYMDYTQGTCQNMFTEQQVRLMRNNLTMRRQGVYETQLPPEPDVSNIEMGIHPNPAQNDLVIVLKNYNEEASYELAVYDILGQKVYSTPIETRSWQQISGLYMLRGPHFYRLIENDDAVLKAGKLLFID